MSEEDTIKAGPAFPFDITDGNGEKRWAQGMWLRDYFAAKAMQSLIVVYTDDKSIVNEYAKRAYQVADAMLKAREE